MPFVSREHNLSAVGQKKYIFFLNYYGRSNLSCFTKRLEKKSLGLLGKKIVSSKHRCAGNSPVATYFQFTNSLCCRS